MLNIVHSCKENLIQSKYFLQLYKATINLIVTSSNTYELKEYAKKLNEQTKDVVFRSIDKGIKFNLGELIDEICNNL